MLKIINYNNIHNKINFFIYLNLIVDFFLKKIETDKKDEIKFSCWLQWTLTKLTISLYAMPLRTVTSELLKLSIELEDIIASIDIDMVHEKLKMKISSSIIKHYARFVCFNA